MTIIQRFVRPLTGLQVRRRKVRIGMVATIVLFLTGCETVPTQYRWGIYEEQVYADYAAPGSRSPQEAADALDADIAKTVDSGEKVPPGVYAHLGYLNFLAGNTESARALFEKEKADFPESTVFIDTILANLQGANQ